MDRNIKLDHNYFKYYQLKENDVILDLGATVGEIGIMMMDEIISKNCLYVAVEPVFWNIEKIATLFNGQLKNHSILISTGVYSKNCLMEFGITDNMWCHDLVATKQERMNHVHDVRKEFLPVLSLDTIIDIIGRKINFLKSDIEGAELETIMKCSQIKYIENMAIASYHIIDGKKTFETLNPFLEESGYKVIHEYESYNNFSPYDVTYASIK